MALQGDPSEVCQIEEFCLVIPGDYSAWKQITAAEDGSNLWRLHDQDEAESSARLKAMADVLPELTAGVMVRVLPVGSPA